MTTHDIKKLKEKLPRGWMPRIAKKTGLSTRTVSKVLNGFSQNTDVIDAAIALVQENEERMSQLQQIVNR